MKTSREIRNTQKQLDQQAYQGAKIFFYLFNTFSLVIYIWKSFQFLFYITAILIFYFANIFFYRKCHSTSTFVCEKLSSQEHTQQQIKQQIFTYPALHQCKYCNSKRNYRIKHCKKCENCIYRFDHHCFWIGNCVGQMNHKFFYVFLFTQTTLNIVFTKQYFNQIDYSFWGVFILIMFIIGLSFILFTGYLFLYHSLLIMTAQTTWQQMRRPYIQYLKHLPIGYNPFSQGIIINIIQFFSSNSPIEYKVPSFQQIKTLKVPFNVCQNKYYSCC